MVRDVPYTMMELGLYDVVKCSLGNELLSAALVGGFIGYGTACFFVPGLGLKIWGPVLLLTEQPSQQ